MKSIVGLIAFLSMSLAGTAHAAEWSGRWGAHGEHGTCNENADADGETLDFSAKRVVGYEWDAKIMRIAKTSGVYSFNLFEPASELTGPAVKSKWLIVVAKDGKAMMISKEGGKDWELYRRCK